MSSTPLGFAIVGTGMIANFHAQAIAQTPGARLAGLVSRSPDKAKEFAAKHSIPLVVPTVEELCRQPGIDVVSVATPSGAHLEPALAAIAAGKHLVIEKPLEITPERADRIISAAEKSGVKAAAIFQGRFGAGAQKVKAAIAASRLGRLVLASACIKWHRPASYYTGWKGLLALDGGAVLINQSIHGLDLLQWFAGLPEEVFCLTTRRVHTGIEGEDTAAATLRFPDGALGAIEATTAAWPGWSRRIEICGEHGSICLEDDNIVRWDFAKAEPGDDAIRNAGPDNALGSGAGNPSAISTVGHQRQIQDLVEAIRDNRAPAIDIREGRKAVALVHALYTSAKTGRPVSLA